MLHQPLTIAPSPAFWARTARALLDELPSLLPLWKNSNAPVDLSGVRVVVPAFAHAHHLRLALSAALGTEQGSLFIPPRICTLSGWLALQPQPESSTQYISGGSNQRLMALYGELRQHAWLKKLFAARRNTDLLPLAQTLLTLTDELTATLLPIMAQYPDHAEVRWDAALAKLPPSARALLTDESQLVWSIWKSQLDASDPTAAHFAALMQLANNASTPLMWISPTPADPCTEAFLEAWSIRHPVLPLLLDWRTSALNPFFASAWPEILERCITRENQADARQSLGAIPGEGLKPAVSQHDISQHVALYPASSLEDEATLGAQIIVNWLQEGKTAIAIVAQDRVVARRIRALLQRAEIQVADETGWKLSTTRAAAALAAWFDVVTSRAESTALLDFLKSPFLMADDTTADRIMLIEHALRRGNIAGGWQAVSAGVPAGPMRDYLQQLAQLAGTFKGQHTLGDWLKLTNAALVACGISAAYQKDCAGCQLLAMLDDIGLDCTSLTDIFSFAEWRACVSLHMESTTFLPPISDRRVVMLPLNGTHLRRFDAVLVMGADATHLPSASNEQLFFANAVRRELGLETREARQIQQLKNFVELLSFNSTVVLSWQAQRSGEPNPVSNWVARLELVLARSAQSPLPLCCAALTTVHLHPTLPIKPTPAAPSLIPEKLSASGYASLVACPYQFFATRMLGLSGLDEFSNQVEKRDYGDWLHQILHLYHNGVRDLPIGSDQRGAFLKQVSQQIFDLELTKSAAALGYYDRWQKAMPAYLVWANGREAQGWQFVIGEQWMQQPLRWRTGEVLLQGRIDRIDRNALGEMAVLDYKTSNKTLLKKRIEGKEDYQLPFYGLLTPAIPQNASYVVLEATNGKIEDLAAEDYLAWLDQLRLQIGDVFEAISGGAQLPASGIETVCQYCEVRGLCRKGAW